MKKKFSGRDDIKQAGEKVIADQLAAAQIDIPVNELEIEMKIKEQGDLVRQLKAEKAAKALIEIEVSRLKQLKKALEAARIE